MDNSPEENAPAEPIAPAPAPVHVKHAHNLIYGYLFVLVLAAAVAGTYTWQHNKVKDLNKQVASLSAKANVAAPKSTTTANAGYIKDVGVGYPLSMPKKRVLTTLYLPAGLNVMQDSSQLKTQADLAAAYTESFNDILGYWNFNAQGTESNPSSGSSPRSLIFMSAMSDWENTADATPIEYSWLSGSTRSGIQFNANQKKTFVAQLKSKTAACATDSTKGFSTNDKVYNICYTLEHPQGAGGDWMMELEGYGELEGQPIYLGGGIGLPNATYQSALTTYVQAIKLLTTTIEPNPV